MYRKNQLSAAVAAVITSIFAAQPIAQEAAVVEEVIITGIRGSLERSMDVKRDSSGVVDAISAEDIGKFPDTNLAESLQRISGVSINRVNGEGSEVTVRGFGGGFNLVTLNGRQMPAANVATITGNPLDQFTSGSSRSFDFSNLASEGVSGLQVYKTGRAGVATGGVGATINVQTVKPLDGQGSRGSIGVKAVKDTSGDEVTPEISGLFSWVDSSDTFGISLFGSFQERDSGSRHASVEEYGLGTWDNTDPANLLNFGLVDGADITNEPQNGQLVARPTNLGLGTNEDHRERLNGQLTLQYHVSDSVTTTADVLLAENTIESTSLVDGIWFNGTVSRVVYDGNPVVAAPELFEEDVDGGKDFFFQNLDLGTKDTLESIGFNIDWQVSERLNLVFDIASSEAESGPVGPLGKNVLRFNIAGATAGWQTADFTQEVPQGSVLIDDSIRGNNNGVFDLPDVGSQVTQSTESTQLSTISQLGMDGVFEFTDDFRVDFGVGVIDSEMAQTSVMTQATLGGWGVDAPGDIPDGLVSQVCTLCEFEYDGQGVAGADANAVPVGEPLGSTARGATTIPLGSVSWRADPLTLLNAIAPDYGFDPNNMPINARDDNLVEEEITFGYAQVSLDTELAGMTTSVVLGARYESTDVIATSSQQLPTALNWESDNDFAYVLGDTEGRLVGEYSYDSLLPSLDFSIDISDNLKGRASVSKTLARPQYSDMYTATSLNTPNRITYLNASPSASRGNVALDPLESSNVDVSLEYYYGDANYFSIGYYQKNVANFVGLQQTTTPLFDLRDSTTGEPGTTSGAAVDALNDLGEPINERNLFTMTAILQNPAEFPNGAGDYQPGQAFASEVYADYDVTAVATDPLYQFEVRSPTNSQEAEISGFEIASQHFFGESGFGYQANFTTVDGDIAYDNGSNPSEDQFALPGLSNSANVVLIFEKFGFSSRLAYNWRDEFLNLVNRPIGSTRNPEYVDDVSQLDLNISYEFDSGVALSFDAINLTSEGSRKFGRTETAVYFVQELDPRYVLSARYHF